MRVKVTDGFPVQSVAFLVQIFANFRLRDRTQTEQRRKNICQRDEAAGAWRVRTIGADERPGTNNAVANYPANRPLPVLGWSLGARLQERLAAPFFAPASAKAAPAGEKKMAGRISRPANFGDKFYRGLCRDVPVPQMRLAAKEQRLAGDGRNHCELERLGDQKRRLRPLAGQKAFGVRGDENDRHFE
jgi:hypothetical protein